MTERMTLGEIREHWEEAGRGFTGDEAITPTSRDPYLGALERENVLAHLPDGASVLEVGCGDGAHTISYARKVSRLTALDIAESLIDLARGRLRANGIEGVEFVAGSVLDLATRFSEAQFDVVVSQRCLINLPEWSMQQQALEAIYHVLRPGGLVLMTEGFQEGLDALNEVRGSFGLDRLEVVSYNHMFDRAAFEAFADSRFETVAVRDYGLYLLLSRVLHPLAVEPDPPRHDAPINRAAMRLAGGIESGAMAEYSYNLFYALRKR